MTNNRSKNDINQYVSENIDYSIFKNRQISFDKLVSILIRRKKLIVFIFLTTFITIFGHAIFNKIKNPIYKGGFTLLISDPLSREEKNYSGKNAISVEETALGITKNDMPTLIAYLESYYVLNPVAQDIGIPLKELKKIF